MKKLMIAAAIVCAAAMSQAAAFMWETNGELLNQDGVTIDGDTVTGYYVYIMADNGSASAVSRTAALTAIDGGSAAFLANQINDGGPAEPFLGGASGQSTDAFDAGSTFGAYLVVTDAAIDDLASAKNIWVSDVYSGEFDGYGNLIDPEAGLISFDASATATGWKTLATPTPEPTSGLLLLLGVAGLALRRRRA